MKNILLPVLVLSFLSFGFSQSTEVNFKTYLRDGSVISGSTDIREVEVSTDYGNLTIPIKEITTIRFGIRPDHKQEDNIKLLLEQLNSADKNERKTAYNELINKEISAIPVIEDLSMTTKTSAGYQDYTLSAALNYLKSKYKLSSGYVRTDEVTMDNLYTVPGKTDLGKIKLKTNYGNLKISRDNISKIEITCYRYAGEDPIIFKLLANKHISSNPETGWLNTGLMVKNNQQLHINATGEVSLASLSGKTYTPDGEKGRYNYKSKYYGKNDSLNSLIYGAQQNHPTYGNVVFKIGEEGTMQKAGASYKGDVKRQGVLYLSIYESYFKPGNTGYYQVKVRVKK